MNERPKVGTVLGDKYRVKRVLGEGGMGVVVAAKHVGLGRSVALKLLHNNDPHHVARLEREARVVARLQSDHVVKVLDVGRLANGAPFIVMELLEGEDLGAVVSRGPLSIGLAVEYVLQACEAIAEGHAHGVVHRDLKPGNLFLTKRVNGQPLVKVLDFGLAKRTIGDGAQLTLPAATLGSPVYMSPEQVRASRDVDARTDIWSLGVCLYELLTTAVPFEAPTVTQLFARILNEAPLPCRRYRPIIPEGLSRVIERCLEKDPRMRYATIAQLAQALEPFAPEHAQGAGERLATLNVGRDTQAAWRSRAVSPRSPSASAWLTIAGVAAAGIVVTAAGLLAARASAPRATATSDEPLAVTAPVAIVPGPPTLDEPVPPPTFSAPSAPPPSTTAARAAPSTAPKPSVAPARPAAPADAGNPSAKF